MYDCTGAGNQIWQPQPDGTLKNPQSGRCLDTGPNPLNGTQLQIWDCNPALLGQQWTGSLTDTDGTQGFRRQTDTLDASTVLASVIHTPTVTQTAIRSAPVTGGQDLTAHLVTETDTATRTWLALTSSWRWTETQTTYDTYGNITDVKNLADTATTADDTCTHID